jgi:predicted transcriptional regulator
VADWTPHDDGQALVQRGKLAIGQAVRSGRRSLGVSQHTFGIYAGISQQVISRLETGRLTGIRWQTLARIIGLLEAAGAFRLREIPSSRPDP